MVHGNHIKPPCTSLVFRDGRYWCGEVLKAKGAERERVVKYLGVGAWCSSTMFNLYREALVRTSETTTEDEFIAAVNRMPGRGGMI